MIVISHFKSKAIQLRVYFPIPRNDGVFFKRIFFCVVCLNSFVVIYFVLSLSLSLVMTLLNFVYGILTFVLFCINYFV